LTALLVPGGDAPELSRALDRLVGDPALRRTLGQQAGALAHERYTGARVAEQLVAHYRRLATPT
jgi:glycosyltransferase involved in cell wall biosynthesis